MVPTYSAAHTSQNEPNANFKFDLKLQLYLKMSKEAVASAVVLPEILCTSKNT